MKIRYIIMLAISALIILERVINIHWLLHILFMFIAAVAYSMQDEQINETLDETFEDESDPATHA